MGPAIAGVVLAQFGASWAFFANAASYLAVIVALMSIPRDPGYGFAPGVRQPLRSQFSASLRVVRATPGLRSAIALMGVGAFFGQPIFQLMPVLAEEVFHVEAWRFGLMAAALVVSSPFVFLAWLPLLLERPWLWTATLPLALAGAGAVYAMLVSAAGGLLQRREPEVLERILGEE